MINALATAPQVLAGFAEPSPKTNRFQVRLEGIDAFRQSILRSGTAERSETAEGRESHTD